MAPRHASPIQALQVDESFDGDIYADEPMARHTTYRIGGPARYFVRAASIGALARVVEICERNGIDWVVVGRGSNLLVSDKGFDGVVITLGRDFRSVKADAERGFIVAGAGALLSAVVQEAFHRSLAGLEFAVGTPGSVGGALMMNAGTRDLGLGERVESITLFTETGGLEKRLGSDLTWGYRTSSFEDEAILLECELKVEPGDPYYLRDTMEGLLARRQKSQPLGEPSCGSIFRNPEGASVGALIQELGIKGKKVGGAQVSPLHGNFIVNIGGATANDVLYLMDFMQRKVKDAYGIELTPEVRFLGFAV